jgi:hypothetical protein
VNIDYASIQVASVTPDNPGDFEVTFSVPIGVSIPSSNTVTATIVSRPATSTASHSVPSASISVASGASPSGSSVAVTGSHFPGFAPVSSLKIGNVQVLPPPGPNTDVDGTFTSDIIVPDLPPGSQVLQAIVGGITAISTFTITAPLVADADADADTYTSACGRAGRRVAPPVGQRPLGAGLDI